MNDIADDISIVYNISSVYNVSVVFAMATIDASNKITKAAASALILINVHTKWPLKN